jgi:hypothetical protein
MGYRVFNGDLITGVSLILLEASWAYASSKAKTFMSSTPPSISIKSLLQPLPAGSPFRPLTETSASALFAISRSV